MNNVLTYCGLVAAKKGASDKDLPVKKKSIVKIRAPQKKLGAHVSFFLGSTYLYAKIEIFLTYRNLFVVTFMSFIPIEMKQRLHKVVVHSFGFSFQKSLLDIKCC